MSDLTQQVNTLENRMDHQEYMMGRHQHLGFDNTQQLESTSSVTPPAGSNNQVQFNDNGAFGADSDFTYNNDAGGGFSVTGKQGSATGSGGGINLDGGAGGATSGNGGAVSIDAGDATAGTSAGGAVTITSGDGKGAASGGAITITGGAGGATDFGGSVSLVAGVGGATSGGGGNFSITGGNAQNGNSAGGDITIQGGAGKGSQDGGDITLRGGDNSGSAQGGDIILFAGGGQNPGNILIVPAPVAASGFSSGNLEITTSQGDPPGVAGKFLHSSTGNSSAAAGNVYRLVSGTFTSNATPTNIDQTDAPDLVTNQSMLIEAFVVASRTSGSAGSAGDSAGYVLRALYKNIAGTVTLVGSVQNNFTAEDQAGWDATFVISSTRVFLQVTGAANNNVFWKFELKYTLVDF